MSPNAYYTHMKQCHGWIIISFWIIQSKVCLLLLHANLFWHGFSIMKICSCRIHFIEIFHIKVEMEVSGGIRLCVLIRWSAFLGRAFCAMVGDQMASIWERWVYLLQQTRWLFLECHFHLFAASCRYRLNMLLSPRNLFIFQSALNPNCCCQSEKLEVLAT